MFFELLGFVLTVGLGLFLVIWGIFFFWFQVVWSGRENFWYLLVSVAGGSVIYLACKYGPISVVFN